MMPLPAPAPRKRQRPARLPGAMVLLAALTLSGLGHAAALMAALRAPGATPNPEDSVPEVLEITLVSAAALTRPAAPPPAPSPAPPERARAPRATTAPTAPPPVPPAPQALPPQAALPAAETAPPAPQPQAPPPTTEPPVARQAAATPAPMSNSAAAKEARQSWGGQIRGEIDRQKRFPAAARSAGLQGKVRLALTVRGDGALLAVQLAASSGQPLLDEAALSAARAAAPFPPAPAKMGGARSESYTFRLALAFTL